MLTYLWKTFLLICLVCTPCLSASCRNASLYSEGYYPNQPNPYPNTFSGQAGPYQVAGQVPEQFPNQYPYPTQPAPPYQVPPRHFSQKPGPQPGPYPNQPPPSPSNTVPNASPPTDADDLRAKENGVNADEYSAAFVTVPDGDMGKKIALALVEKKLAAVVNIIPHLRSVYEWKGKICEDNEALLMVRTRSTEVGRLDAYVRASHPYEVFEVISLPIKSGNPDYLKWIGETIPARH